MNASADLSRGRPVFVLAVILTAWVGGRLALYEPADQALPLPLSIADVASAPSPLAGAPLAQPASTAQAETQPQGFSAAPPSPWLPVPDANAAEPAFVAPYGADITPAALRPGSRVVGHARLLAGTRLGPSRLLNARASVQELPAARPNPAFVPRTAALAREQTQNADRFSVDAWGLWRDGTQSSVAAGAPSYGRSQAGAVLRFAFLTSSAHAPEAHLRASTALDGAREHDLALGVSARPLPALPVRVAVEGRVTDTAQRSELRAGAYAVSELAPFDLPAGTRGEVYVQAGYVTGEFATAFVDGQARVTRDLAELDDFRLSAGGGAWGGAQEGAKRLDVGPTASVSFPIGDGYARVSADYRVRVSGDAEPDSGPALTLATGF